MTLPVYTLPSDAAYMAVFGSNSLGFGDVSVTSAVVHRYGPDG